VTYLFLYLLGGEIVGTLFDSKDKCETAVTEWNAKYSTPDLNSPIRYTALCVELKVINPAEALQEVLRPANGGEGL
jgi:hypothetical protein